MSILYGVFHILLRKEKFFKLNRRLLIAILIFSAMIPLTYIPEIYTPDISIEIEEPTYVETQPADYTQTIESKVKTQIIKENKTYSISSITIVGTLYIFGLMLSLILSIVGISRTISLIRKSKKIKKDGYSLLLLDKEIPAFSFGKNIVISKTDYQSNKQEILTHEEAHVRHMHSLDLLLLEVVKIIYWFNPLVYIMTRNLKEIHEYQADEYTINNGIDAINYQKLIIKKCVGYEQFALANSFHHCQIKKRIAMINKKQTGKACKLKAAAFIPVACMLLMSFSNTPEKKEIDSFLSVEKISIPTKNIQTNKYGKTQDLVYSKGMCILINKNSYLWEEGNVYNINDTYLTNTFIKYKDYSKADNKTKKFFKPININGKRIMVSTAEIRIEYKKAAIKTYNLLINKIDKTVLNLRNNFSKKIFDKAYADLSVKERKEMNLLIPMEVISVGLN